MLHAFSSGNRSVSWGKTMTAGKSIIAATLVFSSLLCFSQGNRIDLDVKLVLVTVTVTDKHNRFVQGLKKENFQVWEDKIEQQPTSFSSETVPVTLGIILDKSGSMGGRRPKDGTAPPSLQDHMISRASSCLQQGTREDEYFLLEFSNRPMITADFTNDISKLGQRLIFMDAGGSTALWDAIYLGVRKLESASHPRKALLVLTDGDENSSRYSLSELKAFLREEDVRIYSMDRKEVQIDGMAQLSDLTGGRVFRSSEPCKEFSADLRNQYVIGYKPTNGASDGAWRDIRVRIRPDGLPKEMSDLNVRARKGYYAEQGKP
jgi:Ca-activated chloride channel homolog